MTTNFDARIRRVAAQVPQPYPSDKLAGELAAMLRATVGDAPELRGVTPGRLAHAIAERGMNVTAAVAALRAERTARRATGTKGAPVVPTKARRGTTAKGAPAQVAIERKRREARKG